MRKRRLQVMQWISGQCKIGDQVLDFRLRLFFHPAFDSLPGQVGDGRFLLPYQLCVATGMRPTTEPQNRWHTAMGVYFYSGVRGSAGQFCCAGPHLGGLCWACGSRWLGWADPGWPGLVHVASSTPGGSVNKAPGFWRPRLSLLPQSAGQSKSPD